MTCCPDKIGQNNRKKKKKRQVHSLQYILDKFSGSAVKFKVQK